MPSKPDVQTGHPPSIQVLPWKIRAAHCLQGLLSVVQWSTALCYGLMPQHHICLPLHPVEFEALKIIARGRSTRCLALTLQAGRESLQLGNRMP